jgi:hypothetical protein
VSDLKIIGQTEGDGNDETRGIAHLRLGQNQSGQNVRIVFDKIAEELLRRIKVPNE